MLHVINSLPTSLYSLLDQTNAGDSIIFTENAVLAIKQENFIKEESLIQRTCNHINLYALKTDLLIRNIPINELLQRVIIIDESQYQHALSQECAIKSYN